MSKGTLFRAVMLAIVIASPLAETCRGDAGVVDDAIQRLANGPNRLAAKRELELASSDEVVPKLVRAILVDPAFSDNGLRYLAYQILYNQRAAQTPEGLDLLVRGIGDESKEIALVSVRSLRLAPADRYGDIVDAFNMRLPKVEPQVKAEIYLTAAAVGMPAAGLRAKAVAAFKDSDDAHIVFAATYALLRFGSADVILEKAQGRSLKANALRGVIMALARYGGQTKGSFHIDSAKRNALRNIVIDGAVRAEEDVRSTAIQALIQVFGDEAVLKDGSKSIVNPTLEAALQRAAASPSANDATMQDIAQVSGMVRAWAMAKEPKNSDKPNETDK